MSLKVCRESRPEAEAARWCRVGWEWRLKGDGLFANCGHFWPEHDGFNDHFNAWLNRAETWNAVGEELLFLGFCFQTLYRKKECSFMVQLWAQTSTPVCNEWLLDMTYWFLAVSCSAICSLSVPTAKLPYVFEEQQNRGTKRKHSGDINLIRTIHHPCVRWRDKWVSVYLSWAVGLPSLGSGTYCC